VLWTVEADCCSVITVIDWTALECHCRWVTLSILCVIIVRVDPSTSPQPTSLDKDNPRTSVRCSSSSNLSKISSGHLSIPSRHSRQSSADSAAIFHHRRWLVCRLKVYLCAIGLFALSAARFFLSRMITGLYWLKLSKLVKLWSNVVYFLCRRQHFLQQTQSTVECNSSSPVAGLSCSALVLTNVVTLHRGPVNTSIGDHLLTGRPSRYLTSHLGQLSLSSLQVGKSSTSLSG